MPPVVTGFVRLPTVFRDSTRLPPEYRRSDVLEAGQYGTRWLVSVEALQLANQRDRAVDQWQQPSCVAALSAHVRHCSQSIGEPMATATTPNIIMIMADDVGIWNVSAYHRGMMGGSTPHLDRLAREGALFTDYYVHGPAASLAALTRSRRPGRDDHQQFSKVTRAPGHAGPAGLRLRRPPSRRLTTAVRPTSPSPWWNPWTALPSLASRRSDVGVDIYFSR